VQALRVRNCQWTRTQMSCEQPPQVPARHAKSVGQTLDVTIVQRAFGDQPQATIYGCRRASPGGCARRTLGPASQTRAKARLTRCRSRGEKADILASWWIGRADGAAVYACRFYTDEETSIETGIPGKSRSFVDFIANCCAVLHDAKYTRQSDMK
jgi:hypothetical protein